MKKTFLLVSFFVFCFGKSDAQTTFFSSINDTPLGIKSKYGDAVKLADGGYLLNLNTDSALVYTVNTNLLHIEKIDGSGNLLWSKSFGKHDCHYVQHEMIEVNEDLFAIVGMEERIDSTFAMITFINADGDSLGMHRYFSNGDYHYFNRVIKTTDGGFLAAGAFMRDLHYPWPSNYNLPQTFVVKTDSIGNEEWQVSYGPVDYSDVSIGVVEVNNYYLVGGATHHGYNNDLGKTYGHLAKIAQDGILEWINYYPDTAHLEFFNNMKMSLDGNLIICGGYEVFTPPPLDNYRIAAGLVLKMDIEGEILWKKEINTTALKFYDFVELPDSSIVTAGYDLEENDSGLFKFNGDGDEIWRNSYVEYIQGSFSNPLYTILNTDDNGFLMTGYALDPSINNHYGGWVLKVDSMGCVDQFCLTPSQDELQASISVYPNPFNAGFRVVLPAGHDVSALRLLDLAGRTCYQRGIESYDDLVDVEAADLPAGMYFLELLSKQGRVVYLVVKVE
jgi:hypothetical protein